LQSHRDPRRDGAQEGGDGDVVLEVLDVPSQAPNAPMTKRLVWVPIRGQTVRPSAAFNGYR